MRKLFLLLLVCLAAALATCKREEPVATPSAGAPAPAPNTLQLLFAYSSEKKKWIDEATAQFNAQHVKTAAGNTIVVTANAMGSGEAMDLTLSGQIQPHLLSPASAAFIKLANATAHSRNQSDLLTTTDNLVLSPVVIAMWKPMAQALGWNPEANKTIGWSDILALARNPQGWAAKGHPEWGSFRFGHTHPEYSNSGLISVIAETYAATGKQRGLSPDDLAAPTVATYIHDIEKSVVHYGSSTGFFADKMFANGPRYLSAAVLYESNVVDSYASLADPTFPLVAIYPREGTFWSDHPVGIVNRPWVTSEHQEAGKKYIQFLLSAAQQKRAMFYGFRPADLTLPLEAPLDKAHGIDPSEPKTLLEVPSSDTIASILTLWRDNKKHANIVLIMDTSGSMSEQGRMPNAKAGAAELVKMLNDNDTLSIVPFSTVSNFVPANMNLSMKTQRPRATDVINSLVADGNTRLFNTIAESYDYLQKNPSPDRITAIVVLTDGADTAKEMTLDQLLAHLRTSSETTGTRIFTIGYGADAQADELKRIAEQTQAKFFEGKPENIREVFKEIATFF